MALLQVLPRCSELPDPTGPLLSSLPLSVIEEVNAAVTSARQESCWQSSSPPMTAPKYHCVHDSHDTPPYFTLSPPRPELFGGVRQSKIINALEFNFAQSHVRKNRSGEVFP